MLYPPMPNSLILLAAKHYIIWDADPDTGVSVGSGAVFFKKLVAGVSKIERLFQYLLTKVIMKQ